MTVDQSYQTYCPKCGAEGTIADAVDNAAFICTNQECEHTWEVSSGSRPAANTATD